MPLVHNVLIMTVEPGKGGQKLIENTITKIVELKKYTEINNIDIDIEADGGINKENINSLTDAGVNIIVSGSGILKTDDFGKAIKELKTR